MDDDQTNRSARLLAQIAEILGVPVSAFYLEQDGPSSEEISGLLQAFSRLGGQARRRILATAEAEARKAARGDG